MGESAALTTRAVSDEEIMAIVGALDPGAAVKFSEWTGKWYIEARIEIGDGAILRGVVEHHDTPHEAVQAYFLALTSIPLGEYVASRYHGHRREWRWNGAAFAEITRPEALDAVLTPHPSGCDCEPCFDLRVALAEIDEAEREAWRTAHDIWID